MKLSFDIIAEELSDIICYKHVLDDNYLKISNSRYADENNEKADSFVYIYKHLDNSPLPRNVIYCGNKNDVKDIFNKNIIVKKEDVHFSTLYNRLSDIFRKYDEWEDNLFSLINENGSPQEMLDVSRPIFNAGLTLIDWNHNVIAATHDRMDGCPLWEAIQNGYGYKYKFIIENSEPKIKDLNKRSEASQNWNNIDNRYLFNVTLTVLGLPQYGIGVHKIINPKEPFGNETKHLLEILAKHMTILLEKYPDNAVSFNSLFYSFISDIFKGIIEDPDKINSENKYIDALPGDNYCMACIHFEDYDYRSSYLEYRASELEQLWPKSRCVLFEASIMWILPIGKLADIYESDNSFKKRSRYWVTSNNAYLGYSTAFSSLKELKTKYEEAYNSLEYGLLTSENPEERIFNYFDHFELHILDLASTKADITGYVHPTLNILKRYDAAHNTDFYSTLVCYVSNQKLSVNEIAEKLHIHRNTFNYRIEKIKEITNIDITAPSKQDTLRLSVLCSDVYPKYRAFLQAKKQGNNKK